ncbi:ABC transporter ATP-binding protein [Romboutsia maritimum]|uniref:ABC transporter ATP-binding protein n=1 Tax=Romboutsia maritimum TaxID=2020948 RepID=A0A371IRJ7_9FIRM|nr:ABC transporter ATP-binding protein [Romboutsia maritimum]RDY23101.1 ABC transporter ATP-binding protein [Romboutsia maritimum]
MKQKNNYTIFSFIKRDSKKMMLAIILSLFSVVSGIIPYFVVAKILTLTILKKGTIVDIFYLSIIGTCAFCFKIIFFNLSTTISHKLAYKTINFIRYAIVDKLAFISMGEFQKKKIGEYKQLIMDDMDKLEYPLAHAIPEITSNLLGFIAIMIYLFIVDWRLALAGLVPIIISFIIYGIMMKGGAMEIFKEFNEGTALLNSTTVEYINGMEVVKAFNQTVSSIEKFSNAVIHFRDVMTKWFSHCWPYLSAYNVIMPASIAFVLPIGGILLKNNIIDLSIFIMGMILSLGIAPPVMKLIEFTDNIPTIMFTEAKLKEILSINELEQRLKKICLKDDSVEFNHVSFGYEENNILHDISFKIKPKTMTAFVGTSGAGKSTVAKLIARFWDVKEGEILVGGENIKNIPLTQLMDEISFVSQDNFLFDMTIRENIKIGNKFATDDEIEAVCKKTGCLDFILKLPQGFDTAVGNTGELLSGGERQRIAIARAMIKNASIIILDEATAFTDPENEEIIQKSISNLTKDKTVIIIAHRLSTIVNADKIILFNKGRIVNEGTHNELLENSHIYKDMWQAHIGSKSWGVKEKVQCLEY